LPRIDYFVGCNPELGLLGLFLFGEHDSQTAHPPSYSKFPERIIQQAASGT
jgi:hypothetical protein